MTLPIDSVDREALKAQLQQAVESFRHLIGLFVQSAGFLFAAEAVLVGYAITQKKSAPLLIASIVPLAILGALVLVQSQVLPISYVAIQCERLLLPGRDTLAETYTRAIYPAAHRVVESAITMEPDERIKLLRNQLGINSWAGRILSVCLLLGFLAQLTLFFIAQFGFNYHFM